MQRLMILVASVLACVVQTRASDQLDQRYVVAYSYMTASPEIAQYCRQLQPDGRGACRFALADSTVFMEYSILAPALLGATGVRDAGSMIDSLVREDAAMRAAFKAVAVSEVLPHPSRVGQVGLFFAQPRGKTLMAALLAQYSPGKTFQQLMHANDGIFLLFSFDDQGRIADVDHRAMHFEP